MAGLWANSAEYRPVVELEAAEPRNPIPFDLLLLLLALLFDLLLLLLTLLFDLLLLFSS